MRTRISFRAALLACATFGFVALSAQVSWPDNVANAATDFVGWDNDPVNPPLRIMHEAGDQPIEFYTTGDNISEMWLTPTLQNFVFNGYTNLDLSGNLGVGPGFSAAIPPLSRLHLNAEPMLSVNSYTLGYRDWMRTGMLATEGRDGMYVGLKNEGSAINNPALINPNLRRVS